MRVENSFLKLYENPDVAIHAAKEIRNDENPLVVKNILANAYLLKGGYLESVRITFEKSDAESSAPLLLRKFMIAREFYHLGLYEQTFKIISPLLSSRKKSGNAGKTNAIYAELFQLEAKNLIAVKQLKSAQKSLKLSTEYAKNSSDLISKENQLLAAGILAEMKQRKEALILTETLLKSLENLPRNVYIRSAAYQLQGNLYFEEQQYKRAIGSLHRALSLLENTGFEPLKNSIYADLMKNYLVIQSNKEYDFYKKKLADGSKSLDENRKEARRELIQLNTEFGLEEVNKMVKKEKNQFFFTIGSLLLLVLVAGFLYLREIQKAKAFTKQIKFLRSINAPLHKKHEGIQGKDLSKKPLLIPIEKEKEILEKLNQFEGSKKYLDNNMSLATLSVQLGTNTKYLSEIINKYKDKNFNSYINALRIKYVIQLLSTDRSYHQYKISYIAEICGFTTHSAFTNVFKSVTGFSPHEYIQNLRNSER
ncbi:AraC family transcriptional regulator [Chryseobacterium koreense]|uniref:helix-turn-helix domain-containing protein n=1 Tax=Chryseobacterium koreense TaxID=232216 RepID=UPI0026E95CDB|nr:AraC family transcriptional regulator [Chryseobacterium koreense]